MKTLLSQTSAQTSAFLGVENRPTLTQRPPRFPQRLALGLVWWLSLLTSQATLTNSVSLAISGNSTTWALLSSPYNHGNNTVPEVLANTAWIGEGTAVFVLDATGTNDLSSSYSTNSGWSDPTLVIAPGLGFFISFNSYRASQHAAVYTVTFSGETFQSVALPPYGHRKRVGSPTASAGHLATQLNFPVQNGDAIWRYSVAAQAYTSYLYVDDAWDLDVEPSALFGEGVLVQRGTNVAAQSWSRP